LTSCFCNKFIFIKKLALIPTGTRFISIKVLLVKTLKQVEENLNEEKKNWPCTRKPEIAWEG